MKEGRIKIAGQIYIPVAASYGQCCVKCDLGQMRCGFECESFEENEDEFVALRLLNRE